MKRALAVILIVVSMVAAELPRPNVARQTAPYNARGWRPSGPQFNLPQRAAQQQLPQPQPSYGPPPAPPAEEPDTTTTEQPYYTTTVANVGYQKAQSANLMKEKENLENLEEQKGQEKQQQQQQQPQQVQPEQQYYVLIQQPQPQNYIYAVPQTQAQLVQISNANLVQAQKLQALPVPVPGAATVSSTVFTPFSGQYVQIYQ